MLLGGRYLQQEYAGEMMGSPFAGINIIGYDNHTKKYVSVWMDSMSTGIYHFVGTASADGKTITQECSYDDPARGPLIWRSVTMIVDDRDEPGMIPTKVSKNFTVFPAEPQTTARHLAVTACISTICQRWPYNCSE